MMPVMSATIPPKKRVSIEDFVARVTAGERLEIVDGEIVEQAISGSEHAFAMAAVTGALYPFNRMLGDPRGPGGWWLYTDLGVGYANGDVYAHDLCGFRRDLHETRPTDFPVMTRPDWACEILSHKKRDLVIKPRTLHEAGVPHYWVLDHKEQLLFVHRWSPEGYIVVLRAAAGQAVRAEPFDAIEISVSELFGHD